MSRKRDRRVLETAKEFEEKVIKASYLDMITSKADSLLFTVDRIGSKSTRRKLEKAAVSAEKNEPVSKTDKQLVRKVLNSKSITTTPKQQNAIIDIWDSTEAEVQQSTRRSSRQALKKGVKLPLPGQSYHPNPVDHVRMLQEAEAMAHKKQQDILEARMYKEDFERAKGTDLPENNDEDGEHDDDDSHSQPDEQRATKRVKKTEKLTKAQRNKQKAHTARELKLRKQRETKKQLRAINTVPALVKHLKKEEREHVQRLIQREQQRLDLERERNKRVLKFDELSTVPLTDELHGSLRQVVPKGVHIQNRVVEMRDAGLLMRQDRRQRKKNERPHQARRVSVHLRYKQ